MLLPGVNFSRSIILISLLLCSAVLFAQKTVHFENIGFDEAVEKAKKQKKIVFVDVRNMNSNSYTEKVEKDVFTIDSVADFFNAHCISIRINMGTDEGKKFAPKLAMLMYPVYVFHGRNGDQLDFISASAIMKEPPALMEKVRSALATDKLKNSNTRSITFTKGDWNTVLQKAKSTNKLIFLDAQTTWCRPCIMMAKDVFTLDRVADFYNDHFVNVTMDMEKGDGPVIVKKYGINAYPTFLYIDGDGKLVHQDGGYQEADRFIQNGKTAVTKRSGDTTASPKIIPFPGATGTSTITPAGTATSTITATDTGMRFTDGSWTSLLARAKQNNKLIFLDANASWCGPCKQMRKEIFPQQAVAQIYNRNFINVDMDMEKGEGIEIKKKYGVKAYPTFLYINGDGQVVHKTLGSCSEAEFRQHALDALSPHRNLLYLAASYKAHAKEQEFVSTYLSALEDAGEAGLADTVAVAYFESREPAALLQSANWQILREYVTDATSAPFLALVKDQAVFQKLFGTEEVDAKIYQTYLAWPRNYVTYPDKGKPTLDQPGFDTFLKQVQTGDYAKKEEIIGRAKLTVCFGMRDWRGYATTVDNMLTNHVIPMDGKGADLIYSFADIINRFGGDDRQVLTAATQWARLISQDIKEIRPSDKATYLDLYATLLEKTGQTGLALQARKEINQQQLSQAKDASPFKTLTRIVPNQNGQPAELPTPLHLVTGKPAAGQKITFDYTASTGRLAGQTDIRAVLFYYTATTGSGYYAEECTIKQAEKDHWTGHVIVPDSAIAFAIRLRSGKLTEDNGGRGAVSLVYQGGAVRPEAYAGAALLYANGETLLGIPNKADTAMSLLEKEFALHPALRSKYEAAWYNILVNIKKQDAYPVLDEKISLLLSAPAPALSDYKLAVRLFQLQKKKKSADSLLGIAAIKYPGSELAVQNADLSFYKVRDLDSLVDISNAFHRTYANASPKDPATETGSYFAATISTRYIQKKQLRRAIDFAAEINDIMADYRGFLYSWVALELVKADSALDLADSLIHAALAGVEQELAHPELFRRPGTPLTDWKAEINKYYTAAFYDTYGRILAQQGKFDKALAIQKQSVTLSDGSNNGFNEHYVKYLVRSGDATGAKNQAIQYVKNNGASDSVKIWLKQLYVGENGSDKGYDAWLAGLQTAATAKFRETALKEKLDLPMKTFALRGLDGREVTLASLQGKVVIIDFWATWCGPCKASFPAMQITVDKFKNDTNVVFLFVDTWESLSEEQRLAEVKKFIQDNKYSFHVLLDKVTDLEKRQYSVVSDYGVGGIPTKFVLSPEGRVVFKAVGFDGNNEKLVTELSVYIELAKG